MASNLISSSFCRFGKKGLLYIATGTQYVNEAISSALKSKPFLTDDFKLALVTNQPTSELYQVFDYVITHPEPIFTYRDKIIPLINLPFKHTLFMDTDACLTYHIDHINEMFRFYDICASHAPVRFPPGWVDSNVPALFPELNTGLLLLKRSSKLRRFMLAWLELYDLLFDKFNQTWDQASFRSVLWNFSQKYKLSFFLLPPECNLRTPKPWIIGRGSPVYAVHGRYDHLEYDDFIAYINQNINQFRTYSDWLSNHPASSIRPRFDNPVD